MIEKRILQNTEIRMKAGRKLEGYAAVFDSPSLPIAGLFTEYCRHGCFETTIQKHDIRCLVNHEMNNILGRSRPGKRSTLKLIEDTRGLLFTVELPNTTYAKNLEASIERGDISGCSFQFNIVRDQWRNNNKERDLLEVKLYDVGPVAFPAYPETKCDIRSYDFSAPEPGNHSGEPRSAHSSIDESRDRILARVEENRKLFYSLGGIEKMSEKTTPPYSFGEFLQDVAYSGMHSYPPSKRLNAHQDEIRAAVRSTGLNEAIGSEGGFLAGNMFADPLLDKIYSSWLISQKCRRTTIQGKAGIRIPCFDESDRADDSRHGGIKSYWLAEGATITSSKPKIRRIDLSKNKLCVVIPVTNELLQDSPLLEATITPVVVDELGFKLQRSIYAGNGAGKPIGITMASCTITIALESGQTASTGLLTENLVKMFLDQWNKNTCEWFTNDELVPQLNDLGVVNGEPVFKQTPDGDFILGRRVNYIEQAEQAGTAGDIALCDFSQYQIFDSEIDRALSMHIKFYEDESVFRFILRVDGAPTWSSSVKPYKNSDANARRSPFVVLATRS